MADGMGSSIQTELFTWLTLTLASHNLNQRDNGPKCDCNNFMFISIYTDIQTVYDNSEMMCLYTYMFKMHFRCILMGLSSKAYYTWTT